MTAASGTNFGSTAAVEFSPGRWAQVSLANNKGHTVDFFALTDRNESLTRWALNSEFGRFDFTWAEVNGDNYDVRVENLNFGDIGAYGWVNCPSTATEGGANPNRWCYRQTLKLNLYPAYASGWDTSFGGGNLLCHELGHTVGLRHETAGSPVPSCMQEHEDPDDSDTRHYSQEDLNHVLGAY